MDAVADALLAAVFAAPADDTPRLVYADYLDERGGAANVARAEFVRVQCEHARRPADAPERLPLKLRAGELHRRYAQTWNAPALTRLRARHPQPSRRTSRWVYRRGFVASIEVSVEVLRERADDVFAVGPLEHLRLTDVQWERHPRLPPHVARLTAVTLPGLTPYALVRPEDGSQWGSALACAPVLIVQMPSHWDQATRAMSDGIAAGRLSPVLLVDFGLRRTVLDPLRLWPLVRPHVEPFDPAAVRTVLPDGRTAESVRYTHLVRHYQRVGWPPHEPRLPEPEPHPVVAPRVVQPRPPEPERLPEPASEPQSLLSRVAGWLRGRAKP